MRDAAVGMVPISLERAKEGVGTPEAVRSLGGLGISKGHDRLFWGFRKLSESECGPHAIDTAPNFAQEAFRTTRLPQRRLSEQHAFARKVSGTALEGRGTTPNLHTMPWESHRTLCRRP